MPKYKIRHNGVWGRLHLWKMLVTSAISICLWNLAYDERRMAIILELTVSLEEEAISDLCCQFPIPADYDGEGSKGSKFVFYL